jgi:hypothetical protein
MQKEQNNFLNLVDAKSISRTSKPASPTLTVGHKPTNTISYASRVTKPAFSAYASNPSHVATSYAVPNPELFLLFVTNQSP